VVGRIPLQKRGLVLYLRAGLTHDVGHNLPQEAPQDFAKAVIDVDRY
jgi:hypothetical protein